MQKIIKLFSSFIIEVLGIVAALVLCNLWLVRIVDQAAGFWHEGERRDSILPGESQLALVIYAVTSAFAIYIALYCIRLFLNILASRFQTVCMSLLAAIASLVVFQNMIAPHMEAHTVIIDSIAVALVVAGGSIIGSLLVPRSNSTRL